MGTSLDNFPEIDAIIVDIIFYGFADHIYIQSQRHHLFLVTAEEKQDLGGTRFINKACILYKRLLGTSGVLQVQSALRRSKFIQMEE
jgi:hypothetical protein